MNTNKTDPIKIFDIKFKDKNSYYALGCNFIKYMFIAFTLMLLPFSLNISEYGIQMAIYYGFFLSIATSFHLKPFLFIKQEQQTIPYFKLMRDTPINRKDFIRSRKSILFRFVKKYTLICLAISILSSIYLVDTFSLENTLISAFSVILFMFFITLDYIYEIHKNTRF